MVAASGKMDWSILTVACLAILSATVAQGWRTVSSALKANDPVPGHAVEVRRLGGPGVVLMFGQAPDLCDALQVAGADRPGCRRGQVLKAGRALFEMPDGTIRLGLMSGAALVALGMPVPVNLAGADDLSAINGIGAGRASAIIAERIRGGPFESAASLARVKGIGPSLSARLGAAMSYESDM